MKSLLTELMDASGIPGQPVDPLADTLVGALDEAAPHVAMAVDPVEARSEIGPVRRRFVKAVTSPL